MTSGRGLAHRFVWSEAGEERYRALLGEYLATPRWRVRYIRFEGDVAARAEEHLVWVGPDGAPGRRNHQLAEDTAGAALPEAEARTLAREALAAPGAAADLPEVSAESTRRPARTDWTFTFRDPAVGDLAGGEARVAIEIAGDEVVDTRRYVFVPEEWRRADQQRETALQIAGFASIVVFGLLLVAGAVVAVVRWTRGAFDLRLALAVAGTALTAAVVTTANNWPVLMNTLSTAQPLPLQLGIGLSGSLIGAGLLATLLGLLAGYTAVPAAAATGADRTPAVRAGLALGLGVLGALAAAGSALGGALPPWSSYDSASAVVPWLAVAVEPVQGYLTVALMALLVVTSANTLSANWTRRQTAVAVALVLVGAVLAPGTSPDDVVGRAILGLLSGALLLGAYVWVLRDHPALVVLAAAAMMLPGILDQGLDQAYGGALVGSLLGAAVVGGIAWRWFAHLTAAR